MKLDMNKAMIGWVEWEFLKVMMEKIGFTQHWISMIMKSVFFSYFVIMNGEPHKTFNPSRGLRQRNLLLPYLFIFMLRCLVVLSHMLTSIALTSMSIGRGVVHSFDIIMLSFHSIVKIMTNKVNKDYYTVQKFMRFGNIPMSIELQRINFIVLRNSKLYLGKFFTILDGHTIVHVKNIRSVTQ